MKTTFTETTRIYLLSILLAAALTATTIVVGALFSPSNSLFAVLHAIATGAL